MCFSNKVIVAAGKENNSEVFTEEFEVVSSNNISMNIVKILVLNIPWIGPVN